MIFFLFWRSLFFFTMLVHGWGLFDVFSRFFFSVPYIFWLNQWLLKSPGFCLTNCCATLLYSFCHYLYNLYIIYKYCICMFCFAILCFFLFIFAWIVVEKAPRMHLRRRFFQPGFIDPLVQSDRGRSPRSPSPCFFENMLNFLW